MSHRSRAVSLSFQDAFLLGGLWIAAIVFFLVFSLCRLVDADEACFLYAAKLVLQGKTPYVDFFYQQKPLLPYVYALWFKIFGVSWTSGRLLSALLSGLSCGALGFAAYAATRRAWLAGAAMLLFAGSSLVFSWYAVAKTFSLSMAFVLTAYAFWTAWRPKTDWLRAALVGLCLGLSVSTRLILLPLILLFVLDAACSERSARERRNDVVFLLVGFLGGLAPVFHFLYHAPDQFLFDTVYYHARCRSEHGFIGNFPQKAQTLLRLLFGWLGPEREERLTSLQFALLLLPALAFLIHGLRRKTLGWLDATFLVLFTAHLAPTPAFIQYFSTMTPFLALCAVRWTGALHEDAQGRLRRALPGLTLGLCLVYAAIGAADVKRLCSTDQSTPGMEWMGQRSEWSLDTIRAVSKDVDRLAHQGARVVTWWPAYYLESLAEPFPGLENPFGSLAALYLDPEEQKRYKVISPSASMRAVCYDDRVALVFDPWIKIIMDGSMREMFAFCGYEPIEKRGGTALLTRGPHSPRER